MQPRSGFGLNELLDTALMLHDENPGLANGVGDMLCAHSGIEHISSLQNSAVLNTCLSVSHLNTATEYGKDLLPVIGMPLVWLICPMKAGGDSAHIGNVCRSPGAICFECAPAKYFHAVSNT